MKKFFRNRGFRWLGISVLVLLLTIVLTTVFSGTGHSSTISSVVGIVTTPMQWMATKVSNWFGGLFNHADQATLEDLQHQVEDLEAQLKARNEELVEYYDLKEENEWMKSALNVKESYPEWEVVGAAVIAQDPNDLFGGFTINKGSYAGIEVGDPVVTENGLVGQVTRVSTVFAKVDTIFNPDVSISCNDLQTGDYGILKGDKEYCDRNLVRLTNLDTKATVTSGDLIVTSGLGGVYPSGIVVGYATELTDSNLDISLTAVLRPAVQIKSLREVVIIKDFPGHGEVVENLNNDGK